MHIDFVCTGNICRSPMAEVIIRDKLADAGLGPITTEIKPLSETPAGEYYRAEDEHQQYLFKNPNGYCPVHSTGVACGI